MLNSIIVDDTPICADMLNNICSYRKGLCSKKFYSPAKALTYAKKSSVQLAFLDAGMCDRNGLRLGVSLKKINPDTFIVFTSRGVFCKSCISDRAGLACADAFLTKPYDFGQIDYIIDMAVEMCSVLKHDTVRVTTFGGFSIYVGEVPVRFSNAKAKELLAICVDCAGRRVSMYECMKLLWPQREHTPQLKCLYRKAVCHIKSTLKEYGISDIFENFNGGCRIEPQNFSCDYYDYLNAADKSEYAGSGIYLHSYPWAGSRAGEILFDMTAKEFPVSC